MPSQTDIDKVKSNLNNLITLNSQLLVQKKYNNENNSMIKRINFTHFLSITKNNVL